MPLAEESGLYVDPPETGAFRWQELPYFQNTFQRHGLAEMDFAWWDEGQRTLHLLELKDYSPPGTPLPGTLIDELVQKATDCLLLLGSVWHDLPHGASLRGALPPAWHVKPAGGVTLRLTFVVKTIEKAHLAAFQPMQDRLRNKLAGRLEVFRMRPVTTVLLMDHQRAAANGVPVQVIEEARAGWGRRR